MGRKKLLGQQEAELLNLKAVTATVLKERLKNLALNSEITDSLGVL